MKDESMLFYSTKKLSKLLVFSLIVIGLSSAVFADTFDFWGYTYDTDGNPLNNTNITITLYNYSNWENPENGTYSNTSDGNGFFNLSGIPLIDDIMYKPSIVHYKSGSSTDADYVGKSLPSFPAMEFENLNNISFYLQEAATINLTVYGEDLEVTEVASYDINTSFKTGLAYNPVTNKFFVLNNSNYILVYNSDFTFNSSSSTSTLTNASALAYCNDTGLLYVANATNITSYNITDWSVNNSWNISGYNLTRIYDMEYLNGIWYLSTYNSSFSGILKLNLTPTSVDLVEDVPLDSAYKGYIENYDDTWYLAYNSSGTFNMTIFDNDWNSMYLSTPYNFTKQVDGLVNANGTWYYASAQDNTANEFNFTIANKQFEYMVKDTKLGYPVAEQFGMNNRVKQATIYLPVDRNYSIMVYPQEAMPSSYNLNNISDYGSSPHINISINVTEVLTWVYGYVNTSTGSGLDSLTVVPYIFEPGNMVFSGMAMPYNMSAWRDENHDNNNTNNVSDQYNASGGFFNITIPGNTLGNNVLLFITAYNSSEGTYYGAFKNITVNASGTAMEVNATLYKLMGSATNITMNDASDWSDVNVTTAMKNFSVRESTGDYVDFAHIEVEVDYSSYNSATFSWMTDIDENDNGAFSIPVFNASITKINIFSQADAPLKTSLSVAELQSDPVIITLNSFKPGKIEDEIVEEENYNITNHTRGLEYNGTYWFYLNGTDKLVLYTGNNLASDSGTFNYNSTVDLSDWTDVTNVSAFYKDNVTEIYMNTTYLNDTNNGYDISDLNYTAVTDIEVYQNLSFVSAVADVSGTLTNVVDVLNITDFSLLHRNTADIDGNNLSLGYMQIIKEEREPMFLWMGVNDSGGKLKEYMVMTKDGYKLKFMAENEVSKVPTGLQYKAPTNDTSDDDCFAYTSSDNTINIFAIESGFDDIEIGMYKYSDDCNVPYPSDDCMLGGSEKTFGDDFNPMSVIMGGGKINFRMRKASNNITVQFNNVDMLASGPPDAMFDDSSNTTQGQSAMAEAWRFGSMGPEIYDDVLLGIPYNSSAYNDDWDFTVTIDKFYDEDWNVIWERGVNSTDNLTGTEYADYATGDYASYVNDGMACSKSDSTMSSALCYVDTTKHMIWMKIPHFSGINPVVNGTALANGEVCDSNDDCASNRCVSDYDGSGKWCAASGDCYHDGTRYGDGEYSDECYDSSNRAMCDDGDWTKVYCTYGCSNGACKSSSSQSGSDTDTTISETETISVSKGQSRTYPFSKWADIAVEKVVIKAKNTISGSLTIEKSSKPSGASAAISSDKGSVYKYIKITKSGFSNSDIDSAIIKFKVPKSWISSHSIDKDTIVLKKYVNDEWIEQPTTKTTESTSYVYYEATVSGFSYFAVAGESETPISILTTLGTTEIIQGDSKVIEIKVKNNYNQILEHVSLTLSGIGDWYKITPEEVEELAVGSTATFTINFSIPFNATVKDYEFTAKAASLTKEATKTYKLRVTPNEATQAVIKERYTNLTKKVSELEQLITAAQRQNKNTTRVETLLVALKTKLSEIKTNIDENNYFTASQLLDSGEASAKTLEAEISSLKPKTGGVSWSTIAIILVIIILAVAGWYVVQSGKFSQPSYRQGSYKYRPVRQSANIKDLHKKLDKIFKKK
ncbi:MAG: PGF-pre-PGF domain-containing protein [Candidatus Aenigmarchaeota archaeon]|nr:PGF-pre-PGF domain-containing protein [Candidatus Aenigmarchaeota archaeon]